MLAAFTREALTSYLPEMQRRVAAASPAGPPAASAPAVDAFKRLALEVICDHPGPPVGATFDAVAEDYELVGGGFSSLPIPLPGTAYHAPAARSANPGRLRRRQGAPDEARADGLSESSPARAADGRRITVEEVKVELHHIVVAGLIVWPEFVTHRAGADRHPEVRERLTDEVARRRRAGR